MPRSKEQICRELDGLNIEYSTEEKYNDLWAKLKAALNKEAEPVQVEAPVVPKKRVPLGKGCDAYGDAINDLLARVEALEAL